jgi:foldase protein PrsA
MLNFFRKYATIIAWTIVIFFGGTMFAGTLIFGRKDNSEQTSMQTIDALKNALAIIDSVPVDSNIYSELLYQYMSTFQAENKKAVIPPEIIELARFRAFNQAVNYSLFLDYANSEKIKISKKNVSSRLDQYISSYKLKSKKELKALLKKNNYPYKAFLNKTKNNLKVEKTKDTLLASISVNDKDLENHFKRIKLSHILIKFDPDSIESQAKSKEKATQVLKRITTNDIEFDRAVSIFSEDKITKQNFGKFSNWMSIGQLHRHIEAAAFSLPIGIYSEPIKSDAGYHIIVVTDSKFVSKPKNYNKETLRKELMTTKETNILSDFILNKITSSNFTIRDPYVKAVTDKFKGDYDEAIASYQQQIAKDPNSPLPHYFISKIRNSLGETSRALIQLNKAKIKGKLYPTLDFSNLHIERAKTEAKLMYENKTLKRKVQRTIKKYGKGIPITGEIVLKEIGKGYKQANVPSIITDNIEFAWKLANNDTGSLKLVRESATLLQLSNITSSIDIKLKLIEKENKKNDMPVPTNPSFEK